LKKDKTPAAATLDSKIPTGIIHRQCLRKTPNKNNASILGRPVLPESLATLLDAILLVPSPATPSFLFKLELSIIPLPL
jgi:hypothetical protein